MDKLVHVLNYSFLSKRRDTIIFSSYTVNSDLHRYTLAGIPTYSTTAEVFSIWVNTRVWDLSAAAGAEHGGDYLLYRAIGTLKCDLLKGV